MSDVTSRPTMQAIVQRGYGSADVWRLDDIERPSIDADEVLVEVRAAGMDRGTWHLMAGLPYAMRVMGFGLRGPKSSVPGLDLAGVVVAVGSDVTRFVPGDEVYGIGTGSFAELAAAKEAKLGHKPTNLTFEQAAAVPVSGLTALQGLTDSGRLEAGQHVLITGASGGVGTYAVQIAKALGAEVTGVCSTAQMDLVRAIGADHVLDYTRESFAAGDVHYDLILDIAGHTSLKRLRRLLTPKGTAVLVGSETGGRWLGGVDRALPAAILTPQVGQRLAPLMSKEDRGHHHLTELVEAGPVVPPIERTKPLADAAAAMRHLEAGQVRGKLVIVP
jgi:NADPH:quinone reductase-like Zn-dependent oxidoreductase